MSKTTRRNNHPNLRVALYSHDTMGLGHTRRNILIANTLSTEMNADCLLITGSRTSANFQLATKVDCLTLPSFHKAKDGSYRSKSLDLPIAELIELRSQTIVGALKAYRPDVLIVDNVPRGALNELDSVLEELSGQMTCVLGLRDVLDEPMATRRQWRKLKNLVTIEKYFSAIWIYGDPKVFDACSNYQFDAQMTARTHYVGYLDARERLNPAAFTSGIQFVHPNHPSKERLALCLVGGGQDGAELVEAFAQAKFPNDMKGLIVTGPYMQAETKHKLKQHSIRNPRLEVVEFLEEPTQLLLQADRVVAMGGYNTVTELLSFQKHALIVPRVMPRLEQFVRAERLQKLGLIKMLHPKTLTPAALTAWLASDLGPNPDAHQHLNLRGLERLPLLLKELTENSKIQNQEAIYV